MSIMQTCKGLITQVQTQPGSLVANNPMYLLCTEFIKIDPLRDGTQDILVQTNVFFHV